MNLNGAAGFGLFLLVIIVFAVWVEARLRLWSRKLHNDANRFLREITPIRDFLASEAGKHGGGRRWTDRQP